MTTTTVASHGSTARRCRGCGGPMVRRQGESHSHFKRRVACSVVCAQRARGRVPSGDLPRLALLREALATARVRGDSFAAAWTDALRRLGLDSPHQLGYDAAQLAVAVEATRPAWRRAYEGRPATCGDVAAGRLPAAALDA